jgi:hypothetical protein
MIPQLPTYITEVNTVLQIPHFESPVKRCSFVLSTARKPFLQVPATTVKTVTGQPRKAAPGYFNRQSEIGNR